MSGDAREPPLDPIDGLSEVMFGLFMALTFTGTMSVALGAGATVHGVLLAALACNIAWGIVDAAVTVLGRVTGRLRLAEQLRRIRMAPPAEGESRLRDLLPNDTGRPVAPDVVQALAGWIRRSAPPESPGIWQREDARVAVAVFLRVCGATLPPVLPFLLVDDLFLAMRLSNAVAVAMLVWIGWRLDGEIGQRRWLMRLVVPVAGVVLVVVTIALGG